MAVAERVTGRRPAAEGWTTHIPQTLRTMRLSEALSAKGQQRNQEGETYELDLLGEKGGAGYAFRPHASKIDKAQQRSQGVDRVQFEGRGINEASMDDRQLLDSAVYDFQFEPRATSHSKDGKSHISLLEYASKSLLLRATFSNGSVVVYGSVPANVFARLKAANDNGQSVGATFWDYVRIYDRRGLPVGGPYKPDQSNFVREGSKFPFIYSATGESQGPRPEQYQVVRYDPLLQKDVRETGLQQQAREQRHLRLFENAVEKGAITPLSVGTRRAKLAELRREVQQLSPDTLKKLQDVLGSNIDQIKADLRYKDEEEANRDTGEYGTVRVPMSWLKDPNRKGRS